MRRLLVVVVAVAAAMRAAPVTARAAIPGAAAYDGLAPLRANTATNAVISFC